MQDADVTQEPDGANDQENQVFQSLTLLLNLILSL